MLPNESSFWSFSSLNVLRAPAAELNEELLLLTLVLPDMRGGIVPKGTIVPLVVGVTDTCVDIMRWCGASHVCAVPVGAAVRAIYSWSTARTRC